MHVGDGGFEAGRRVGSGRLDRQGHADPGTAGSGRRVREDELDPGHADPADALLEPAAPSLARLAGTMQPDHTGRDIHVAIAVHLRGRVSVTGIIHLHRPIGLSCSSKLSVPRGSESSQPLQRKFEEMGCFYRDNSAPRGGTV